MLNARITGKDEGSQQAVTGVEKLLQLLEPSEKGVLPGPGGTTDTDVLPFAQLLQDAKLVLGPPRASGSALRIRSGNAVPESQKEERLVSASSEERGVLSGGSESAPKAVPEMMRLTASPGEEERVLKSDNVLPPVGQEGPRVDLATQAGIWNYAGYRGSLQTLNEGQRGMMNLPELRPARVASPEAVEAALRSVSAVPESPKGDRTVKELPEESGAVTGSSEATAIAWLEKLAFSASSEEAAVIKRDEVLLPGGKGQPRAVLSHRGEIRNDAGMRSLLRTRDAALPGMTNLPAPTPLWLASPGGAEVALRSVNAVPESPKGEPRAVLSHRGEIRNDAGMRSLLRTRDAALPGMTNLPEPTPSWLASPGRAEVALRSVNAVPESPKGEPRAVLSHRGEIRNDAGMRSLLRTRDAALPGMTNLPEPTPSWLASPGGAEVALRSVNAVPESPKGEGPVSTLPEKREAVSNKATAKTWPEKMTLSASPAEEEASVKRADVPLPGGKGEARAVLSAPVEIRNDAGLRSLLQFRDAGRPGMKNLPGPKSSEVASSGGYGVAAKEGVAPGKAAKEQEPIIAAQGEQGAAMAKSAEAMPQGAAVAMANREAKEEAAANTTGPFLQAEQNNGRKVKGYSFVDAPARAERTARNGEKVLSGKEERVLSGRLSTDEPEKMQKIMAEIQQVSSPGPREAITPGEGTSLENREDGKRIPASLLPAELESPQDDGRRDKGPSLNKGKPIFKEVVTLTNQNDLHLTMANPVVEKGPKIPFFPRESFLEEVAGFLPLATMKGAGRIKITITPPHLGSLEMEVLVRDNKVQVIMMADSRDVQQTLQVNSEQLKQAMQQHGMSVGRFDVLWQGEQSWQRSDSGGGSAFGHNMEQRHERGGEQENEVATLVTASYGQSKNLVEGSVGISLFA